MYILKLYRNISIFIIGNNKVRIYSLTTGEPLHIIGMKGSDNGQFLQPIAVCFLQMCIGGGGTATMSTTQNEHSRESTSKYANAPIVVVGDTNNRLQVYLII